MIKSQSGPSRFKAVRPFPLHRLPSLLKRSLSLSQPTLSQLPVDGLPQPPNSRSTSTSMPSTHILLDLLPSVRSSQFVWTYTRLLCTSSSYIAGMSFYNFIAALLSLGHQQMRIYDVLGASHPTHNRRKLVLAWASTSLLVVLVVLVVNAVVKMSENNFAYQIHREMDKMERIEAKIKQHRSRISAAKSDIGKDSTAALASAPTTNGGHPEASTGRSEDEEEEEEEEEAEQALLASLAPAAPVPSIAAAPPLSDTAGAAHPSGRHSELLARIQAEEDKRAVCRALISSSTNQTAEEIEEEEDAEEALEEALEAGLSAAEIAREASSQRRFLSQHDPLARISSSNIFLYRLCDLVCYYIIFVAVYAFQNTLQLSIHTDTLLWSSVYFVGLLIVALGLVQALESQQDAIGCLRLEQEQRSQSLHDRLANRRLKKLKIQQATWKKVKPHSPSPCERRSVQCSMTKPLSLFLLLCSALRQMSTFVASSFAYLLAYAVWSVMQASLRTAVPGELMKHPLWLWFNAVVLLACSGAFLVLLNVRVYSALGERTDSDGQPSAFHLIRCPTALERLVRGPRASTAGLSVRVDILSGQVTSIHHQMTTEALSYILALSIGAALTSSLPAVPSDAATYNYDVQPSSGALLAYALTCSLVLALSTLWLERWVRKMERKNREKAREVLRSKVEGRERIEIKEVTNQRGRSGEGDASVGRSAEQERFSANTHESALYILKRQFQYERRLRGEDEEQQPRRKPGRDGERRPGVTFASPVAPVLPSPSSSLAAGQPQSASASSPLLSPSSAETPLSPSYGAVSPSPPSPEGSALLFSPLASPAPTAASPSSASSSTSSTSSTSPSSQHAAHRSLLTSTFLHEYYVAIVATLTQGFALLVAYAWTGVFSFVLFPALRRWSFLIDVGDVEIAAVWSLLTFSLYVVLITGAARIFHKEEAFEL